MNYSYGERFILNLINLANRPLINILSLEHVMNYWNGGEKEYSALLKSCFFFYKFAIDDRQQYLRLINYNSISLPWNMFPESESWIYPDFGDAHSQVIRDRNRKLWFKLLDFWYKVFYQNPYLYLKWSEVDGWGWYHREDIADFRTVLESDWMLYGTFVESITEVEMEILKAFGFGSFFCYHNPGSPSSDWWIIFGFWMIANGDVNSPFWFDHLYDRVDPNDPDSVVGLPYRTMVQWHRRVWTEVIINSKYTTRVIIITGVK
jgi:hypothetical protein